MLHIPAIRTFFLKSNGLCFQAVRWFGFEQSKDLGGLIQKVPPHHSLWDAAGGSIAHNYGYYKDTVVTPGDWVVVAYDDHSDWPVKAAMTYRELGLAPVYHDGLLYDVASDRPVGGALERRERILLAALRGGEMNTSLILDRAHVGQRVLDALERYVISGRLHYAD